MAGTGSVCRAGANSLVRMAVAERCCPAFQAKIPQPLREDLPELLSASGMRTPAVRVLLGVFVGKNGFKGPSMQIQVQHIFRAARGEWQSGDKQFVDHSLAL